MLVALLALSARDSPDWTESQEIAVDTKATVGEGEYLAEGKTRVGRDGDEGGGTMTRRRRGSGRPRGS
jgi:hypothetical protein